MGYVFQNASGYWRFNPPAAIREGDTIPAGDPLRDSDGRDGVLIGLDTEGFGIAKMPTEPITTHPDRVNFATLNFPGFLRNPGSGGDIIPPTPIWAPFLTLNPTTGTLYDEEGNPWVDQTYFHGRPIFADSEIDVTIESPRASAHPHPRPRATRSRRSRSPTRCTCSSVAAATSGCWSPMTAW